MNEEGLKKTEHNKIFVGQPIDLSASELEDILEKLKTAVTMNDNEVKRVVNEVVPTYHMQNETQVTEEAPNTAFSENPQNMAFATK